MKKALIDILLHTRDRAANRVFCGNSEEMQELCDKGYMKYIGKTLYAPDSFFTITKAGLEQIKERR